MGEFSHFDWQNCVLKKKREAVSVCPGMLLIFSGFVKDAHTD